MLMHGDVHQFPDCESDLTMRLTVWHFARYTSQKNSQAKNLLLAH